MKIVKSVDKLVFNIFGYSYSGLAAILCVLPFILVLSGSFTSEYAIHHNGYTLWPSEFSLNAYSFIFKVPQMVIDAYIVTITVTVAGSIAGLFICAMTAYALHRPYFKYRNAFALFFYFTTLFSGGLVPWYVLMIRYLNMKNSILALIIPSIMGVFYFIVIRSSMQSIPESLSESARMDGASEFKIFTGIYLPLSKPVLATVGLFLALGYWNNWANAMLFVTNTRLYPLQYFLYNMLNSMQTMSDMARSSGMVVTDPPTESFKLAMTIIATGPIVLLYPFVQRYFISGMTLGAVKG